MTKIKFGTDGWRAIIADDFTVDNVARVSVAVAQWVKKNFPDAQHRGGSRLPVSPVSCSPKPHEGVRTPWHHGASGQGFVSTPMVSLGAFNTKSAMGVILTASHNPPSYNGYKLKGIYGGPLIPEHVQEWRTSSRHTRSGPCEHRPEEGEGRWLDQGHRSGDHVRGPCGERTST
jgi:phosphomannomutase